MKCRIKRHWQIKLKHTHMCSSYFFFKIQDWKKKKKTNKTGERVRNRGIKIQSFLYVELFLEKIMIQDVERWRDLQYSQSVDDTENVQLKQEPHFFTFWISTSPQFDIKATCSQYRQNSFSEYWEITCSDCYREARGEDKDFGVSIRGGDLKLLTRTDDICDLLLL